MMFLVRLLLELLLMFWNVNSSFPCRRLIPNQSEGLLSPVPRFPSACFTILMHRKKGKIGNRFEDGKSDQHQNFGLGESGEEYVTQYHDFSRKQVGTARDTQLEKLTESWMQTTSIWSIGGNKGRGKKRGRKQPGGIGIRQMEYEEVGPFESISEGHNVMLDPMAAELLEMSKQARNMENVRYQGRGSHAQGIRIAALHSDDGWMGTNAETQDWGKHQHEDSASGKDESSLGHSGPQ